MLIVKIMGGDNTADTDTRAQHRLIAGVIDTEFVRREDDRPLLRIWLHPDLVVEGETGRVEVPLDGNVYVMNEAGKTVSSFGVAPIIEALAEGDSEPETDEQALTRFAERFLQWRLPSNFGPDGGISFDQARVHPNHWPTGTNLLDIGQARDMLRYVLGMKA